jgi:hypothetical protein
MRQPIPNGAAINQHALLSLGARELLTRLDIGYRCAGRSHSIMTR